MKKSLSKILPLHLLLPQSKFFYLFHGLLFSLFIYPYLESKEPFQGFFLLLGINAFVVLGICFAVSAERAQVATALVLGLLSACSLLFTAPWSFLLLYSVSITLYLFALILCLLFILHHAQVGPDEIFAVVIVYVLMGILWAILFQLIEFVFPGSFHVSPVHNLDHLLTWSDFVFFSFTTLTTLGYGDMVPVSSQARSLAILEAMTGVFLMALLASKAVASYVQLSLEKIEEKMKK